MLWEPEERGRERKDRPRLIQTLARSRKRRAAAGADAGGDLKRYFR